jgi:polar amino acid transport system substrate-binding protein
VNSNYFYVPLLLVLGCGSSYGLFYYLKKDPNTIIVGVASDYPPFSFKEKDENKGFDVELVREVVSRLGKKVYFKEMSFSSLIMSLIDGRVDIVASGVSPSVARKKLVDFSDEYHRDTYSFLVKDKSIKSLSDLSGYAAGVQTGSLIEPVMRRLAGTYKFKPVSFDSNLQILQSLKAGHLKALFIATSEAIAITKENNDLVSLVIGEDSASEGVAIALNKKKELTGQVNKILQELQKSGFIKSLKTKYGLISADEESSADLTHRSCCDFEKQEIKVEE